MTNRIPATLIESIDPRSPIRLTPAQAGGAIHTRSFTGLYRSLRLYGAGTLFLLFFGSPWLVWGDHQAVLWDLSNSQIYLFGLTLWPQDFILLSALLIIAAFGLFFVTVLAGRVWCGYTCPQSVWTWLFMWVEKTVEGERNQRIKLDAAPWSLNKLGRRSAKHGLWLAASLATALTFVGYLTPIRPLAGELLSFDLALSSGFWLLFFTSLTYLNAGWMREQVCLHMCPYARFQSVMFDRNTLNVAYDSRRGEGRGSRKKGADYRAEGLGDCLDCSLCVQVCPTGIDIRDGLQLACISCGACIDACDSVMDKMDYPRGLVRYASENSLAGGKTQLLRPRLLGYAATLLLMIGAFVWALETRSLASLDVAKDRSMYRENSLGQIENIYSLKVINKTQQAHSYTVALADSAHLELQGARELQLAPGEMRSLAVSVVLTGEPAASTPEPISFTLADRDEPSSSVSTASTFVAPQQR
ncbi:MAG: cytochrome c oxidase accessory protein CcoG [Pseudomonas sp.]|uniref:cytochrome c oxidase accessory protein CcoG n=1 Tax=Pseudomonas sp. TaxID=306 RepID=UPI002734124A|nr:cytochrome c oxidase accessory protein CcoG [Pseudomonas sp.]MDP3847305.1 cytochrome c oxidase accessory protein CcoG [Pseudomonas sp.]